MKVRSNEDPAALRGGKMEVMDIGISDDPEDQLMILNILSSTLYSDKPKAVLREYGCNAFDANVEAGLADTPIEVRLPNSIKQSVAIRDFGNGMTEEQIKRIFCMLGKSTKRNSNDFTGMLGIGSKAGFAYGDYFTVTSYSGGTKTIYNCFRDKGVPRMALMHSEKTNERDGMEVEIPVKHADIFQFVATAEKVFRYFKVRPKFSGAEVHFNDASEIKFKGTNWRYRGDGTSAAIMGNVGYDLSVNAMSFDIDEKHRALIQAGIELEFAIGEIEIAPNREGLQYTDVTKQKIKDLLNVVISEVSKVFTQEISTAPTMWEARKMYGEAFEKLGSYGTRTIRDFVKGNITWKGKKLDTARIGLNIPDGVSGLEYTKPSYSHKVRKQVPYNIYVADEAHLVENDISDSVPHTRVRGFFEQIHAKDANANPMMYLFRFPDAKVKTKFIKDHELEGAPWTLLSTIPKSTTAIIGGATISAHKKKHSAKVFVFNESKTGNHYDAQSTWWDLADVDLDVGGVYVPIENFRVQGKGGDMRCDSFLEDVKEFRAYGLLTEPVHGFKRDKVAKLNVTVWKTLDAHLQENLDEMIEKKKLAQEMADYFEYSRYTLLFPEAHRDLLPKGSIARKLVDECYRMAHPKAMVKLIQFLQSGNGDPWIKKITDMPKPTVDLEELETEVRERYPLIDVMNYCSWRTEKRTSDLKAPFIQRIADYISLVESEIKRKEAQKKTV